MKENTVNIIEGIRQRISKSDKGLWGASFLLMIFSLLLIYSTTDSLGSPLANTFKQLAFFVVAYILMILAHFVHFNHIRKFSGRIVLVIIFGLLVWLEWKGVIRNGAKRWVSVPFIGEVQPSELIKVLLVLYVAQVLARFQMPKGCNNYEALRRIVPVVVIVGLWVGRFHNSAAALMGLTVFVMLVVGRIHWKITFPLFFFGVFVIILASLIAVKTDFRPNIGRVTTGLNRIERFWVPEQAEKREWAAYEKLKTAEERKRAMERIEKHRDHRAQVEAAKAAVATGGLIGKGAGNSKVRYVLRLPYSDYAFAIIVEEFGLVSAFFLLFIYITLAYRAGLIAKRCRRTFPAFLVIGLTTVIVLHAFTNVAVAVDLMPVTGQPLPFVSKGGSSLLATGLSLGMILCVTYWLRREEEAVKHIQE